MRYSKINLLCITLLALCLVNCSTTSKNLDNQKDTSDKTNIRKLQVKEQKPEIPQWFITEQNNSEEYLYGFGSGNSLTQATQNSLADMAQRLQVSVSTTTSFKNITNNDNISQELIQQVATHTNQISIPSYTIINQQQSAGIYFIEIRINKNQAIKDLHTNIYSSINQSQQLLTTIANKSSLFRFDIAQQLNNNLDALKSSLRTLVILAPETDISRQMKNLNDINNNLLNLQRSLQIYIDKQNSGFFYDSLEKFLQIKGYTLVNNKSLANIYITLKLKDYDNYFKGQKYCLTSKIELQAIDDFSKQLLPKSYTIKACSNKGRTTAIDKAVEIFYSQLENTTSIY